ncbi:uncharacterized protein J4E87_007071 [Alternaria ethzedia]|uniref:uncharacterized protein n=1 Tax=Alternaria ethzedia TaxID=181014 RepID=UPI0020C23A05|nr:uncharacterized protein J4E87_007071 [Alternaria ethzedia]KAI4620743.1 hypothetical protein J4E87_007071 [Alternaria ethzedia]
MSIYYGAESDSDDDTVVLLERFSRPSPWSKTPTTRTFHLFFRLPPELRARVWTIALHNQIEYVDDLDFDRPNEVRIHKEKGTITAHVIRGYPTLFFVNREARYEAAKIDGGTWYTLKPGVEIYVNSAKEKVRVFTCYQGPKLGDSPFERVVKWFCGDWHFQCCHGNPDLP